MKRRTLLSSILTIPAAAALPVPSFAQDAKPASETPNLPGLEADFAADGVAKTFNKAEFSALKKLGEIIMPSTPDTPGANEAGAAGFLDFLIGVSPPARQALYKEGLDRLNVESQRRYAKRFADITAAQADSILAPLHAAWSYHEPADPFAHFLRQAKEDLLTATANSREYVTVVSKRRRGAGGVGQYWYAVD